MELYIGGYKQGKLEYVKNVFKDYSVININTYDDFIDLQTDKEINSDFILNNFSNIVKICLEKLNEEEVKKTILDTLSLFPNVIIISDEIGNGIVPISKEERIYRELTGRLLIEIAKKSNKVFRIVCGIAQQIK